MIFTAAVVVVLGGKLAWVLLLFIPIIIFLRQNRTPGAKHDPSQQDKLAEIQNILHETISGNRIVKRSEWSRGRWRGSARPLAVCFGRTCVP